MIEQLSLFPQEIAMKIRQEVIDELALEEKKTVQEKEAEENKLNAIMDNLMPQYKNRKK